MELADSLVFLAVPLFYKNQPRQAQKSKKEQAKTKQDQVLVCVYKKLALASPARRPRTKGNGWGRPC
jgi:hypothetical protein